MADINLDKNEHLELFKAFKRQKSLSAPLSFNNWDLTPISPIFYCTSVSLPRIDHLKAIYTFKVFGVTGYERQVGSQRNGGYLSICRIYGPACQLALGFDHGVLLYGKPTKVDASAKKSSSKIWLAAGAMAWRRLPAGKSAIPVKISACVTALVCRWLLVCSENHVNTCGSGLSRMSSDKTLVSMRDPLVMTRTQGWLKSGAGLAGVRSGKTKSSPPSPLKR